MNPENNPIEKGYTPSPLRSRKEAMQMRRSVEEDLEEMFGLECLHYPNKKQNVERDEKAGDEATDNSVPL